MSSKKAGAVPSLDQAIARLREAQEYFRSRGLYDSDYHTACMNIVLEAAEKSQVSAPFSEGSATGEDEWKRVLQEVGGAVWAVREFVHLPDGQAPTGKSSMGLDLFKSIVSASVGASQEGT